MTYSNQFTAPYAEVTFLQTSIITATAILHHTEQCLAELLRKLLETTHSFMPAPTSLHWHLESNIYCRTYIPLLLGLLF